MFHCVYLHLKTKHISQCHTTYSPLFFFFFCLNSAAIYLECVCHIQPPVHTQASCALRQFCDYTGQAILCVCRAADCERREEDIWSRGDLLQLSVSVEFCGSCFFHSSWSLRSAGVQSVILIKGPIQQNTWHYIVYTLPLHPLHHCGDVMLIIETFLFLYSHH